ncbi:CPBP family intramembrane glutamic endopeptidase [Paraburkholderia aromaticivorans]|uniref:CPBP family intramembrane glutamic endopeptidase n=1 Tax=Paraburkholderia aromaticivorans TaxID=2026199 RepID=UPI00145609CD|nr:CPBP family intramembrane glutamic endopeptidase [Paraburkholderia aromaticivorans]
MLTKFRVCMQETKRWTFSLPTTKLIAFALVGTYLAILPLFLYAPFASSGQALGGPDLGRHDILKMVLMGCIAAPLIETAINQWGCLRLLKKLHCRTGVAICISALIFGLSHGYSAPYVFLGTLVGAILAMVFVIEDARKGHPFIATLAVHALRNGITAALTLAAF